jgi:hypothetical protein
MTEPPNATPSTTEDVPAAPGWVEQAVDEIFEASSGLPSRPSLRGHRNAYLDCLAAAGRGGDIDDQHDRCRQRLLAALVEQEGVSAELARTLEQKLEALEAEISARI